MTAQYQDLAEAAGAVSDGRHTFVPDPWAAADVDYEHNDSWLLSYIDILTLFLTLFVVLLVLQPKTEGPLQQERAPHPVSVAETEAEPDPPVIAPISTIASESAPLDASDVTEPPIVNENPRKPADDQASISPSSPAPEVGEPLAGESDVHAQMPAMPLEEQEMPAASGVPEEVAPLPTEKPAEKTTDEPLSDAGLAAEQMLERLNSEGLSEHLRATRVDEGVSLEVRDNILFAPGSADLTSEGRTVLDGLVEVLKGHRGIVSIEGHSDNVPIASERYPSNWELSSGRASGVARYLIDKGLSPDQLRAVGYADTRPLAANDTPEGRARNRRVTIVIHFDPEEANGRKEYKMDGADDPAPSPTQTRSI